MGTRWLRTMDGVGLRAATWPGRRGARPLAAVTRASDGSALWLVAAALMAALGGRRGRRVAARATVALAATSGLANGPLKRLVRRRRPGRWATAGLRRSGRAPTTSSFPSGHTASGFAFATAAGLEAPILAAPLGLTAGLVGWSRLQGGRHFPADVAAGAVLGTAVGTITHLAWRRVEGRRSSDVQAEPAATLPPQPGAAAASA